jgi:hypothetical protein
LVIRFGEPRDVSTHPLSEIVQAHLGEEGLAGADYSRHLPIIIVEV